MNDHYIVVAAAIFDGQGRVLIAKRPDHVHQGGKWEFPGGKVEPGETLVEALERELGEELGIHPVEMSPLVKTQHDYPDKRVSLNVWRVGRFEGVAAGREQQIVKWVKRNALKEYDFPAANVPVLTALELPSHYLITPEPKESHGHFINTLEHALEQGIKLVQLRANTLDDKAYLKLAKRVKTLCDRYHCRLILNGSPEWAVNLDVYGVQLNRARLYACETRPLPVEHRIGASCHNEKDLHQAKSIGVDFAVLSPVKSTQTHPGIRGIGWEAFRTLTEKAAFPVYALGGLQVNDVFTAKQNGGQGIAAIRSLWSSDELFSTESTESTDT